MAKCSLFVAVLLAAVAFGVVRGDEPPPNIKRYLERAEKIKPPLIPTQKKGIVSLSRQLRTARAHRKRDLVEKLEAEYEAAQRVLILVSSPVPLWWINVHPSLDTPLNVGDIGALDSFEIEQVLGPAQMRISFSDGKERQYVFLDGVSTTNVADDDTLTFDKALEVVGTRQYVTVLGATKTAYVLKPFDVETLKKYETLKLEKREWTIVHRGEVEGLFIGVTKTHVALGIDGEIDTMLLTKLSLADRQWIRDHKLK